VIIKAQHQTLWWAIKSQEIPNEELGVDRMSCDFELCPDTRAYHQCGHIPNSLITQKTHLSRVEMREGLLLKISNFIIHDVYLHKGLCPKNHAKAKNWLFNGVLFNTKPLLIN
jgi:hypothetical protein